MATAWNVNEHGVAIDGYDVVAYHTDHAAVPGSPDFTATYDGVTFQFASADHRDRFREDPTAWLPAFKGWCAFGVAAKQATAPSDPKTFRIVDGRLMLFFNDMYEGQHVDTSAMWDQDEATLKQAAETNWNAMD